MSDDPRTVAAEGSANLVERAIEAGDAYDHLRALGGRVRFQIDLEALREDR